MRTNSKPFNHWALLLQMTKLALLSLLCIDGAGATLVLPPENENSEGISNNNIPFGAAFEGRAQQIYSPSLFPVLPEPGSFLKLNTIAFRLNANSPDTFSSSATFDQVQIYLSTTSRAFNSGFIIGPGFDQNNGPDKVLVFDQQAVSLQGLSPGRGPAPFDISFNLAQPYEYDPGKGSLVMEIWKYGNQEMQPFDDAAFNPGRLLFIYGRHNGDFVDGGFYGMVTQFSYEVVPEPTTFVLLLCGLLFGTKQAFRKWDN
jgi:hypothetical protein